MTTFTDIPFLLSQADAILSRLLARDTGSVASGQYLVHNLGDILSHLPPDHPQAVPIANVTRDLEKALTAIARTRRKPPRFSRASLKAYAPSIASDTSSLLAKIRSEATPDVTQPSSVGYLYHGTGQGNLPAIGRRGLLPSRQISDLEDIGEQRPTARANRAVRNEARDRNLKLYLRGTEQGVYLSTSPTSATTYAQASDPFSSPTNDIRKTGRQSPALLRFRVETDRDLRQAYASESGSEVLLKQRLSPKRLEALVETGGKKVWKPLRQALREVGLEGARWALPMLGIALGIGVLASLFHDDKESQST